MLNYKEVNGCESVQNCVWGGVTNYEIIDFLKGFAISTIVLMHLMQTYMDELPQAVRLAASLGGSGVHIFIFCSGFGCYLSRLRKPQSYSGFLRKRFKKIYLPYICIVFISALLPYMYDNNDRMMAFLSHVFLFKMFVPGYESSFGQQMWFMSTIIQFYFAFIPLCALKEKTGGKKALQASLCISVAWWVSISLLHLEGIRVWNGFFLQYLWEFVLGMTIAEWLWSGGHIDIKYSHLLITAVAGIGLEGAMAVRGGAFRVFNDIPAFAGYAAAAILLFEFGGKWVRKIFLEISRVSYEWYLVHILVFSTVFIFLPSEGVAGQFLTALIALGLSYICAKGYAGIIRIFPR